LEIRKSKTVYFFVFLAAIIFVWLLAAVLGGGPLGFDTAISSFITNIFHEGSYPFFKSLNILGSAKGIGFISLIVVILLWLSKRDYNGMAVYVFAVAFGYLLNMLLKDWIGRPRPDIEHLVSVKSLSFPSGHAMMGMIVYTMIAFLIIVYLNSKRLKWMVAIFAFCIILAMGISRIVLQVHYPSDIASGFSAGWIWCVIWMAVYELMREKLNQKEKG
jgi:undecaprenyl-diphosphatase